MKFVPKTDKEIAEANLWPAANYSFEIIESADQVSKSGNDMIKLKLKVFNDDGSFILLDDYLLESMAFKLKHAAQVCGLDYEGGQLAAMDFHGKCGTLKLKIQKGKKKDDGSDEYYADKNAVGDYVVKKDGEETVLNGSVPHATTAIKDDSIPF